MKAFIYINSSSGSGKANIYYTDYLKNFISENFNESIVINIPCENSEYIIEEKDNNESNTIFIIGGDGTVSLSIENILKYSKIETLNIPIYICPFGSGNGLAKNFNLDPYNIQLKNKKYISPMFLNNNYDSNISDISDTSKLSFLLQTWGIISDIDIDTEYLRRIGDLRFYYGILKSVMFPKYYNGDINITLNDNTTDNTELNITGDILLFCATNGKWISKDFKLAAYSDIFDNDIDILIIRKKLSFYERIKLIYHLINENIEELDFVEYYKAKSYKLKINDNKSLIVRDGEVHKSDNINVVRGDNRFLFYHN
jgi:sphingosine kinase